MKFIVENSESRIMTKYVKFIMEYTLLITMPEILKSPEHSVKLVFVDEIESKIYAETSWDDNNYDPKKCKIYITYIKNKKILTQTIIHEMVHVKQFFKKELVDLDENSQFIWNNNLYNIDKDEYWLLPWEIEANGYEVSIFNMLRKDYRLNQSVFKLDYAEIYANITKVTI
jgi:hypothetical protein